MRNKVLIGFIACLMILGALVPIQPAAVAAAIGKATVDADLLNVREKNSTASKKVGSLKRGQVVEVYANLTGGWSQINFNNKKAYVSTAYLRPVKATSTRIATVTVNVLNVREKASETSKKVGSLAHGTSVQVTVNLTNGWTEIIYNKKKAFVASAYLSFAAASSPATFKKNPAKIYQYKSMDGVHTYKSDGKKYNKTWIIWNGQGPKYRQTVVEQETKDGLLNGWPNSSYETTLKYPLKVGTTWVESYENGTTAQILSLTKSVKTPAGTFLNVVEVKNSEGKISYYAPNVGFVQELTNGKVTNQLIKISAK
ncbi:SH3 domain-containing protein [Bacillus testis]|uniref:SH3 domain-containing protein n=1 Tax=Bacillus testis TaxID=1622072 RepID=UPI00067EE02E|nr:SH3 domain-containing protein [Bacillus testis]